MVPKDIFMQIKQRFRYLKICDYTHWYNFCIGNLSKDFTKHEIIEISLNGIVYDFSVGDRAIEKKEDILNIREYLVKKRT